MDPDTSIVQTVIALQYNPDTLSRSLQIQAVPGGADGVRVDALRLRGPAIETIKLEAELDATDQLEFPTQYPITAQLGLHPQLAQLEMLVNPTVETLLADDALSNAGTLEIIPLEQPLTLFVWSSSRVVPVRLTDPGGRLFMSYLTNKESLAGQATSAALTTLGLGGLP